MTGQDSSRPRDAFGNAPALGPDVDDERQPGLTRGQMRWARDRAEEGFSARAIARIAGVDHSTIRRTAARLGWDVSWGRRREGPPTADPAAPESPPTGASGAVSGPQPSSGPRDRPPAPIAPRATPRPASVRPEPGPPQDERSARLWHCRRCGLSGFDPNRGPSRAWHSRSVCDATVARLDVGLEGGRRERPPWELEW